MANPDDQAPVELPPAQLPPQPPLEPLAPEVEQPPVVVESSIKSEFLEKISENPTFNSVKGFGASVYNKIKGYNAFTDSALNAAESTGLYIAITAWDKFAPVKVVDHIACKTVEFAEDKLPFIKLPPEEIIGEARRLIASSVETAEGVKNYGIKRVNDVLDSTDNLVDRFMPPPFGDGSPEVAAEATSMRGKAVKLSSKFGSRVYGYGVKQFLPFHEMAQVNLDRLQYAFSLLLRIPENIVSKTVDETVLKAHWIWEELNKEQSDSPEAKKSLEQRIMSYARRLTANLVATYNSIDLSVVPATYRETFHQAQKCSIELFTQLDQATNAGDITVSWLQSFRQKVVSMEELIQSLKSQDIEMENLERSVDTESAPVNAPTVNE